MGNTRFLSSRGLAALSLACVFMPLVPVTSALGAAESSPPATEDDATPDVAESRGELTVGVVATRTGGRPQPGGFEAIDAYFRHLNELGGVNGYTFRVVGIDDGMEGPRNAAAIERLVDQEDADFLVLVGELAFAGGQARALDSGIPVIGSGNIPILYQHDNLFPITAFLQNSAAAATATLLKEQGNQSVAILAINVPAGLGAMEQAKEQFGQIGVDVVYEDAFDAAETDFTSFVARIVDSGAEAVNCLCGPTHTLAYIDAATLQGYDGTAFFPSWTEALREEITDSEPGTYNSITFVGVLGAGDAAQEMEAVVREHYPDVEPLADVAPIESWTKGEVIAEAVRRLGDDEPTSENLIAALDSFDGWQGTFNPPLTYREGPERDPTSCDQVLTLDHGEWVLATDDRFICWDVSLAPPLEG